MEGSVSPETFFENLLRVGKKKILLVFLKDSKCHLLSGGKEGDTRFKWLPDSSSKIIG